MKKFIRFIKDFTHLVSNVRQLKSDVENIENKVLAPVEVKTDFWGLQRVWFSSTMGFSEPYREITLEEKVNAIIKALKIEVKRIPEKESEVVAVLPKSITKYKKRI